ncbi:hypothetical protein PJP10_32305, partial [Mycobacterium kansasii]
NLTNNPRNSARFVVKAAVIPFAPNGAKTSRQRGPPSGPTLSTNTTSMPTSEKTFDVAWHNPTNMKGRQRGRPNS